MATINTTTTKKETKAQKFNRLLALDAVKADPTLVEFIEHEIDLLARKNSSGEKKQTKTQKENEEIKARILEKMQDNRLYSITEIQKEVIPEDNLTNQKISALMRQMIPEFITRTEDKRKAYFQKVSAEN